MFRIREFVKSKKVLVLLSAFMVGLFAFSAVSCSSGKTGKVTITYMMWGTPGERETVESYLEAFKKVHPEINVKLIHVTTDYYTKLQTMFGGGTPPDVMYISVERFPFFAEKDSFYPLDEFADANFTSGFFPELLRAFTWRGKLYGIPKDFTTMVMYYNMDRFEEKGVPFPKEGWTWQDFLEDAKKLTEDVDGDGKPDYYGFTFETWVGMLLPWIRQAGGRIVDDTGRFVMGVSPYLEKNSEALQFLHDLIYKYRVAPDPTVTSQQNPSGLFSTGKVAMATYGRWYMMDLKDVSKFRWNVAPLPRYKKCSTMLFTVAYAIAKNSKHPREAWELIKFLTGPEGEKAVAESGQAVPSRMDVARSDYFLHSSLFPEHVDNSVFLKTLKCASSYPVALEWSKIENIIARELDYVWTNEREIPDALVRIQKQVEKELGTSVVTPR